MKNNYSIIIALLSALCLSACAGGGGQIYKPGATAAQAQKDTADCWYEVNKATASIALDDGLGSGLRKASLHNECMYQKGYRDLAR